MPACNAGQVAQQVAQRSLRRLPSQCLPLLTHCAHIMERHGDSHEQPAEERGGQWTSTKQWQNVGLVAVRQVDEMQCRYHKPSNARHASTASQPSFEHPLGQPSSPLTLTAAAGAGACAPPPSCCRRRRSWRRCCCCCRQIAARACHLCWHQLAALLPPGRQTLAARCCVAGARPGCCRYPAAPLDPPGRGWRRQAASTCCGHRRTTAAQDEVRPHGEQVRGWGEQ